MCVAAAAVIGVGVFAMTRTNFFKSRFSSPASYYADVEQAAINKAAEQTERSQAYLNQLTGFKANLTIEDAGMALFGTAGYDMTDAFKRAKRTGVILLTRNFRSFMGISDYIVIRRNLPYDTKFSD